MFSDANPSYHQGIKASEPADLPNHVANCGIGKPHATNNRIERLNGTLRERVKVQRGWKSKTSKIVEGQTPAGLEVKGWKELLEKAMSA